MGTWRQPEDRDIAGAVQAMGWGATKAAIIDVHVVQTILWLAKGVVGVGIIGSGPG